MKTPTDDPVLAEIHAIKDAISAEFGHDIDALFDHLKTVEANLRKGAGGAQTPKRPLKQLRSRQPTRAKAKLGPRRRPSSNAKAVA